MHGSHSLPGEPRTGFVSGLETQPRTVATHKLESRGQASSAGFKRSKAGRHPPSEQPRQASSAGFKHSGARQPLTCCRAKHQHGRSVYPNSVSKSSRSPTTSWATSSIIRHVPQIRTLSTLAQMYGNEIRHPRTIGSTSKSPRERTLQCLLRSSLTLPL